MPGSPARFGVNPPRFARGFFFFSGIDFGGGKGLVKLHNLAVSFLVEIATLRQGH